MVFSLIVLSLTVFLVTAFLVFAPALSVVSIPVFLTS